MKEQAGTEATLLVEKQMDAKYNYLQNKQNFEFTLLEFGSTGCTVCKQMEPVLEEMRKLEKPKVNVIFLNIMHPENLSMMKYFGISAVPMQILLDKQGKEFFRHYGFISVEKLNQELVSK
jgi:thioredoxin 1